MRYLAALAVLFLLLLEAAAYFLFLDTAHPERFEKENAPATLPGSEPRRDARPPKPAGHDRLIDAPARGPLSAVPAKSL